MDGQESMMYRYWGKAAASDKDKSNHHLLVYHSLDVAAAGQAFLVRHDRLLQHLARFLGLTESTFLAWTTFFLALHDLGKFAEGFQNLRCDLFIQLQQRTSQAPYSIRHDSLGYLFWTKSLGPVLIQENWLNLPPDDSVAMEDWEDGLLAWARAVTGHHGQPPTAEEALGLYFSPQDQAAAMAFARCARALLLPQNTDAPALPAEDFLDRSQQMSWWLAGIAVLADWIGSNVDFFGYESQGMALDKYWNHARQQAARAVDTVGVVPMAASVGRALSELFPKIATPTPLQQLAGTLALGAGPQLFILEDVTGAGKTEAAIWLAHRLLGAGLAIGLYIGLPTMATSNAMYRRMSDVYRNLFAPGTQPSLVLAHGAQAMSDEFRQSIVPVGPWAETDYRDEQSATARCTAWLADNRKKALLAPVGVGTIDQALQSVLYSRHQSLRLLGLFGKILIVDEVHACDAYMHKVLQRLLTFHSASGGSAILLSATLPQRMRRELVKAFCQGMQTPSPELAREDYPLLTHVGGPDATEHALPTRPEVARRVRVTGLVDLDEVYARVLEVAAQGRCVCWIRNTVADAREAYQKLRAQLPDEKLTLFHARFAMGDRLRTEQQMLDTFGDRSTAAQRSGRVVIATQVVEQSLDLDFDVMVSDLAPIDLLIQRAGRLCRHVRDANGERIKAGPDQRGEPCLLVYGPSPVDDAPADWYASLFPGAAKVYPDHGQLWLTARGLAELGGFRMPEDARRLIEGVYGEAAAEQVPAALQASHNRAQGDDGAKTAQARLNSIELDAGYAINGPEDWWRDARTPTRLGEASVTVRLARWDGQRLSPWCDGPLAWQLSQVRIREALLKKRAETDDKALEQAVAQATEALPDKGKWTVLLPLIKNADGVWQGAGVDDREREKTVYYDADLGLRFAEEVNCCA